jgi:hypothetical protein
MSDQPDHDVIDDDEHTDPNQEDIGELDLSGEEIPEDLDTEDLDDLVDQVDPNVKGDDA